MEGVIKGERGQEWLNRREHGWYKKDLELCIIKLNPPFGGCYLTLYFGMQYLQIWKILVFIYLFLTPT
jgi:hypothetical protein